MGVSTRAAASLVARWVASCSRGAEGRWCRAFGFTCRMSAEPLGTILPRGPRRRLSRSYFYNWMFYSLTLHMRAQGRGARASGEHGAPPRRARDARGPEVGPRGDAGPTATRSRPSFRAALVCLVLAFRAGSGRLPFRSQTKTHVVRESFFRASRDVGTGAVVRASLCWAMARTVCSRPQAPRGSTGHRRKL